MRGSPSNAYYSHWSVINKDRFRIVLNFFLSLPVRSGLVFGQLSAFCSSSCPKLFRLQTSFPFLAPPPVRSCSVFGQLFVFCSSSCSKLFRVRTAFRFMSLILSEVAPSSDSFSLFIPHPVRTYAGSATFFIAFS